MVKKNVPDWLNSSIWSSPQPPPSPATPRNAPVAAEPPDPITTPAVKRSEHQASSSAQVRATRAETRDPLNSRSNTSVSCSDEENEGSSTDGNSSANAHSATPFPTPTSEEISRQAQILLELSRKVIHMGELRKLGSQGILGGAGIRATVWKLLLGYLPTDRSLWPSELAKKRSQYKHFKDELLMNPSEITRRLEKSSLESHELDDEGQGFLSRSEISHEEHPLSLGNSSVWNQFFKDSEIMEQINRDVMRTHPDIYFFSGGSSSAKSNQEALRSILIVFAKLNPGIRYVQGMNEILAPIFYIFKNDPDAENAASAEADSFFCFVELLSSVRDNFVQQLDNSVVGIRATISRLSQLLKKHDEELWRHLEITTKANGPLFQTLSFRLHFHQFADVCIRIISENHVRDTLLRGKSNRPWKLVSLLIHYNYILQLRWITLLLTQEFSFSDILPIWDTLLSDPDGPQETLLRVCCAMLIIVRRRLLAGDFTSNLKLLQHYPSTNISHLLYVANKLRFPLSD